MERKRQTRQAYLEGEGGRGVGSRGECKYDDIAVPYTALPTVQCSIAVQQCSAVVGCRLASAVQHRALEQLFTAVSTRYSTVQQRTSCPFSATPQTTHRIWRKPFLARAFPLLFEQQLPTSCSHYTCRWLTYLRASFSWPCAAEIVVDVRCSLCAVATAQHHGEQLVHQAQAARGGLQRRRRAAVQRVRFPHEGAGGAS